MSARWGRVLALCGGLWRGRRCAHVVLASLLDEVAPAPQEPDDAEREEEEVQEDHQRLDVERLRDERLAVVAVEVPAHALVSEELDVDGVDRLDAEEGTGRRRRVEGRDVRRVEGDARDGVVGVARDRRHADLRLARRRVRRVGAQVRDVVEGDPRRVDAPREEGAEHGLADGLAAHDEVLLDEARLHHRAQVCKREGWRVREG